MVVGAHQGSSGRSPWHGLGVGPGALVACFEVESLFAWEERVETAWVGWGCVCV